MHSSSHDDFALHSSHDDFASPHIKPIRGFEGGWQAMMRKMPAKKHVHKDTDADLMEHLYDNDGALPAAYTAWKPDDAPAPAPPASSAFAAAAASFDDDSFLQIRAVNSRAGEDNPVVRLIALAATRRQRFLRRDTLPAAPLLFEESSTRQKTSASGTAGSAVTEETINAAQMVLDMYAAVLDSPPLHQLSLSRLSVSELTELWHKLQAVDPMTHPNIIAPTGQQAQAERWCQYFDQNQGSAAPEKAAKVQWEKADAEIADAAGKRASVLEELEARTQLQRTVSQDVRDLTALSQGVRREYGSMVDQMQEWLGSARAGIQGLAGSSDGLALRDAIAAASNELATAQTEMGDLILAAIKKRSAVELRQRGWLSKVQVDAQKADQAWLQSTSQGSQWKSALDAAKKNLMQIESTCDVALEAMERRRHAGRREMRAIRIALLVLDPQP